MNKKNENKVKKTYRTPKMVIRKLKNRTPLLSCSDSYEKCSENVEFD